MSNLARSIILRSAESQSVAALMRRYGLRLGVSRFVAGEDLGDGIAVVRALNDQRIRSTLNCLGEAVDDASDMRALSRDFLEMLDAIEAERLDADISIKLTHLGLQADEEAAQAATSLIVDHAAERETMVWIDMEDSSCLDATLRTYRGLRDAGKDNVSLALQAYLRRTSDDLKALLPLGARIRLVKGAYLESPTIAYPKKADVDSNFAALMETCLAQATYTAVATHDESLINRAIAFTAEHGIPRDRFEFQMMYGVRTRLQRELASRGFGVRVIVSYGSDWYRFFIRRLAERPANVGFVLRNVMRR